MVQWPMSRISIPHLLNNSSYEMYKYIYKIKKPLLITFSFSQKSGGDEKPTKTTYLILSHSVSCSKRFSFSFRVDRGRLKGFAIGYGLWLSRSGSVFGRVLSGLTGQATTTTTQR